MIFRIPYNHFSIQKIVEPTYIFSTFPQKEILLQKHRKIFNWKRGISWIHLSFNSALTYDIYTETYDFKKVQVFLRSQSN